MESGSLAVIWTCISTSAEHLINLVTLTFDLFSEVLSWTEGEVKKSKVNGYSNLLGLLTFTGNHMPYVYNV